jgi:hypothetical protein
MNSLKMNRSKYSRNSKAKYILEIVYIHRSATVAIHIFSQDTV